MESEEEEEEEDLGRGPRLFLPFSFDHLCSSFGVGSRAGPRKRRVQQCVSAPPFPIMKGGRLGWGKSGEKVKKEDTSSPSSIQC